MRNFLPCTQFMVQRFYETAQDCHALALHFIVSLLGQILLSAFAAQPHIGAAIFGTFADIAIKARFRHKKVIKRFLNSVAFIKDDHIKAAHYQLQKGFPLRSYPRCRKARNCCDNNGSGIAFTEHSGAQTLMKIRTQVILVPFFQGVARLFAESDRFTMLRIHPINQT